MRYLVDRPVIFGQGCQRQSGLRPGCRSHHRARHHLRRVALPQTCPLTGTAISISPSSPRNPIPLPDPAALARRPRRFTRKYHGQPDGDAAPRPAMPGLPFCGLTLVSCERGVMRQSGEVSCAQTRDGRFAVAQSRRAAAFVELRDALNEDARSFPTGCGARRRWRSAWRSGIFPPGSGNMAHRPARGARGVTLAPSRDRLNRARAVRAAAGQQGIGLFDRVRRFCLFVGQSRSGHGVLGALLNARQQAVVSHNLDALDYLAAGVGRGSAPVNPGPRSLAG